MDNKERLRILKSFESMLNPVDNTQLFSTDWLIRNIFGGTLSEVRAEKIKKILNK